MRKPTKMSPIMGVRSRNIADASGENDTMSVSGDRQNSDGHLNEKWPKERTIALLPWFCLRDAARFALNLA
jgi:hypothetical protein